MMTEFSEIFMNSNRKIGKLQKIINCAIYIREKSLGNTNQNKGREWCDNLIANEGIFIKLNQKSKSFEKN